MPLFDPFDARAKLFEFDADFFALPFELFPLTKPIFNRDYLLVDLGLFVAQAIDLELELVRLSVYFEQFVLILAL